MPVHDRAAWRACTDRAGFQLGAAWLGTVDKVSLFWSALPPTHGTVQRLATRLSDLHELSHSVADSSGPLLLDVDLDYWGGAAEPSRPISSHLAPSRPAWEISALRQCAELLRSIGSVAWGDARGQRTTDSASTTTTTTTTSSGRSSSRATPTSTT
jgi:hypothetical protein